MVLPVCLLTSAARSLVLVLLLESSYRFSELVYLIGGVSEKMLTNVACAGGRWVLAAHGSCDKAAQCGVQSDSVRQRSCGTNARADGVSGAQCGTRDGEP